jgi:two-component system, OmpR family, response regulator
MLDNTGQRESAERTLRVLVVDDHQDSANSLCQLIGLWGYECEVAYDGGAGLKAACAFHPDCLLLDIAMPVLDGYTLAERVRQEPSLANTKLIALSAFSDSAHVSRAKQAGFDFLLVKPADPAELERLLTMLNEVVRLATKTKQLARQNVSLANETKELLKEVKEDIKEVKEEVKELKEELREMKEEEKGT